MACWAYYACAVAFVNEYQCVVLFCEVANFVHWSNVAIHGEHAVGANDAETLGLCFLQTAFEVGHVGVGIAIAYGLAETYTIDDAGMVEGVADDSVFGSEEGFEHTAVGIKACGIENGVFGLEVVADGCFELFVHVVGAANEAYARHTEAAFVHGVFGCLDETGMIAEAEVVVGTEVEHCFTAYLNGGLLWAFNEAFFFVEACFANFLKLLFQVVLEFTVHVGFVFVFVGFAAQR